MWLCPPEPAWSCWIVKACQHMRRFNRIFQSLKSTAGSLCKFWASSKIHIPLLNLLLYILEQTSHSSGRLPLFVRDALWSVAKPLLKEKRWKLCVWWLCNPHLLYSNFSFSFKWDCGSTMSKLVQQISVLQGILIWNHLIWKSWFTDVC